MKRIFKALFVGLFIILFLTPPSFCGRIHGTWKGLRYTHGFEFYDSRDCDMQVVIKRSGEVSIISINKLKKPHTIERSNGKIEGEYIVFDDGSVAKYELKDDNLIITDTEDDFFAIFEKIGR